MKINISMIIVMLFFFSAGVCAGSIEDDLIQGNTIVPLQKQNVRLLSEEVRVSNVGKITANFILENLSNAAFTMSVGFPFRSSGPKNFKVYVQEQPVDVSKRLMGGKGEISIKDKYSGFTYEMFNWNIHFDPSERKTIRLEYAGQWGSVLAEETAMHFVYVTKTGSLWPGNIEKSDFYIALDKDAEQMLNNKRNNLKLFAFPQSYKINGNQLEWHFRNWEPTENISIAVMADNHVLKNILDNIVKHSEDYLVIDKMDDIVIQEARQSIIKYFKDKDYDGDKRYYMLSDVDMWVSQLKFDLESGKSLFIRSLRNEIYARHGRIFSTPDMKQIFGHLPWYKPNADFKETELNTIEKKNVEFILEYEKKMGWK